MARFILKAAGHPILANFHKAVFVVYHDDHPSEYAILLYPHYDAPEFEFLLSGLPEGGIAVDLGSNIGLYSIPFALKTGQYGKVLSLDANSAFGDKLVINAQLSGVTNIAMEIVAVGDKFGTLSLQSVAGNPGTATVGKSGTGHYDLPMKPLVDILESHNISKVDVMKVDIDGSEEMAMIPFLQSAKRELLPKRLVMEHILINENNSTLLHAIKQAGFVVIGKTKSNTLYERQG